MELGFCWVPYLWKISYDSHQMDAAVGYSQICFMVSGLSEWSQETSSGQTKMKDWKSLEACSQAGPSWTLPFIVGTCLRASYKDIHWEFVFRDCLGHRLCWDFLNGNWLFSPPTNLKCNINEKTKTLKTLWAHAHKEQLQCCFSAHGESIMRKNEAEGGAVSIFSNHPRISTTGCWRQPLF